MLNVGNGWTPYADRLSLALVEMVLSEAMFSANEETADNRELANTVLSNTFARLPLPAFPSWAEPDGPGIRWLTGPDVLLRNDSEAWLWVYGRSPKACRPYGNRYPAAG